MKFNKKQIIISIVIILILSQLIRIDKNNPPITQTEDFLTIVAPDTMTTRLIKDACYDCHSNETTYPWYTDIAPVSWWIKGHINEGRQHLNFSKWSSYPSDKQKHKLEECVEMMEKGEMPMKSFTWTHPEARLTDEQNTGLISFFKKQFDSM